MMRRIRRLAGRLAGCTSARAGWPADISARAMRLRSGCVAPSCCRPWRFPGTVSSSRCRRRSVSGRDTSPVAVGWRMVGRTPRAPGSLHWCHPPLAERQHLSLLFDRRVLRIGRVAFLLDLAKLGLDQGEACVFAFEFATQAIGKRMAFGGLSVAKSIRVRRSFGSMPRMPWANSSPLIRLIWPVRSRTRR